MKTKKYYQQLKKIGKLNTTADNAYKLGKQRDSNRPQLPEKTAVRLHREIIPLGPKTDAELDKNFGSGKHTRKKNWRDNKPLNFAQIPTFAAKGGRYSSSCTYTFWKYNVTVGCYGIITRGGGLLFRYGIDLFKISPPAGYKFTTDENGILIISIDGKRDYHPNSDDLREYSKAKIRQKAIDNYRQRQAVARQNKEDKQAIIKAEREGAMICVADSVRAGNCQAGTIRFAERHGLDPKKHYKPTTLLAIDAHRVRLAVTVGLRRHRHEMTTGYCNLADHNK